MKQNNVVVKKTYIQRCDCCKEIGTRVEDAQADYFKNIQEKHPDENVSKYDTNEKVLGVEGYIIKTEDNDRWNCHASYICSKCFNAMLKAADAIHTKDLETATVKTQGKELEIFYDEELTL